MSSLRVRVELNKGRRGIPLRKLSNIFDHNRDELKESIVEPEQELDKFLRLLSWFYCQYEKGAAAATAAIAAINSFFI